MTLASMAGIQLTDDRDSDHSSWSGAMQPPSAAVEEINVPVFIDEYLQQLNASTLTAPTDYNTNNNNSSSSKPQHNGNGDKENVYGQQEQHHLNCNDITTFENFDFDFDMIGYESTEEYQEQVELHQEQQLEQEIVNSVPAWNDINIINISNSNLDSNDEQQQQQQHGQHLIEQMQTDKIDEQFKILPFSSEMFLSEDFSQHDQIDILQDENAVDISDFNNDNISLSKIYNNNNPMLSSDSYSSDLLNELLEDTALLNPMEELECGHNNNGNSQQLVVMTMDEDEQMKIGSADCGIPYGQQQQQIIIIPSDSQTIISYPQQQAQSENTLTEFFYDHEPYTPQSPPQSMPPSPASTSLSPKSRMIKRSSRSGAAMAKAKAQLNLNIPKATDSACKLSSDQYALQTPDVIRTILAYPQTEEPVRSIPNIIEFLQGTPNASNANTTLSSTTTNIGDYSSTHCESNVSSPKSFAEYYDDQTFTPQSHTSYTTNTTTADYYPNSPALSVTSSTHDRKCSKKRGRPAKQHSDQPDERTLAEMSESEQKRILDRAKNNEASRLSRMRAKEKEELEIAMETKLMEDNKELSRRLKELERLEADYKKQLMSQ